MRADELTEPGTAPAEPAESLLSQLPRTRPQRSSARRAAARATDAPAATPRARASKPKARASAPARTRTTSKPKPARKAAAGMATGATAKKPAKRGSSAAKAKPGARAAAKPSRNGTRRAPTRAGTRTQRRDEAPVPLQGYASDGDTLTGSVAPPGGPEFVATAAEIVGELAKAGASGGERVVKGLLSRFRLS